MAEIPAVGSCRLHGSGHLGSSCPDQNVGAVEASSESYTGIGDLFAREDLPKNIGSVVAQLENIRGMLLETREFVENLTDDGVGEKLDEYAAKILYAYQHFIINSKKIDISALTSAFEDEEVFNQIILGIKGYFEDNQIRFPSNSIDALDLPAKTQRLY